jgi:hypothetical protein
MHEDAPPHCSWCGHFCSCLVVDMVIEWGYCDIKVKDKTLSHQQVQNIKDEIQSGNYEILYALEKDGILFMPTFDIAVNCTEYRDAHEHPPG